MTDAVRTISALKARERTLTEAVVADPDAQTQALRDAVAALEAAGIPTALTGGLAVGIRSGSPRATLDVDLATLSAVDRAAIVAALTGAGFSHRGSFPHSESFRHANGEPARVAVDTAFDDAVARAEAMELAGAVPRVVTTEDLVVRKRCAATDPTRRRSEALRDLADVALLEGDVGSPDEGW